MLITLEGLYKESSQHRIKKVSVKRNYITMYTSACTYFFISCIKIFQCPDQIICSYRVIIIRLYLYSITHTTPLTKLIQTLKFIFWLVIVSYISRSYYGSTLNHGLRLNDLMLHSSFKYIISKKH